MITREIFSDMLNNKIPYEYIDFLLDLMETNTNTEEFILAYQNESALIWNTRTYSYISWYKLTHIGRFIQTNVKDIVELDIFLDELLEDLIDAKERTK